MSRRFLEALFLRDLSELRRALLNEPLLRKHPDAQPAPGSEEIGAELASDAELPQLPSAKPPQVAAGGQETPRKL